jgi:hypothetical protein
VTAAAGGQRVSQLPWVRAKRDHRLVPRIRIAAFDFHIALDGARYSAQERRRYLSVEGIHVCSNCGHAVIAGDHPRGVVRFCLECLDPKRGDSMVGRLSLHESSLDGALCLYEQGPPARKET